MTGIFLVGQELRLHIPNAVSMGLIPDSGTKIPHVSWHSQKANKVNKTATLSYLLLFAEILYITYFPFEFTQEINITIWIQAPPTADKIDLLYIMFHSFFHG